MPFSVPPSVSPVFRDHIYGEKSFWRPILDIFRAMFEESGFEAYEGREAVELEEVDK